MEQGEKSCEKCVNELIFYLDRVVGPHIRRMGKVARPPHSTPEIDQMRFLHLTGIINDYYRSSVDMAVHLH